MKMYSDICGSANSKPLPTGAMSQCLEAVTVMLVLAKWDFKFASVEDFKSKEKWDEAIIAKEIVPLYELYELTSANTDAVFYESRNFKKETSKAVKITTGESYLSFCSHAALKSYEGTDYTKVFEVTEDGNIIGVYAADGIGVQGQSMKSFDIGIRMAATTAKPAYTPISITYADYEELEKGAVLARPDFNPVLDLTGIFAVEFTQVGPGSATTVVVKAAVGCGATEPLVGADSILKLLDAAGVDQSATAVEGPDGTYTFTGTDLESGTVTTDGAHAIDDYIVKGQGTFTVA